MTENAFQVRAMTKADLATCLGFTQAVRWPHKAIDWQLHFELGNGSVITDDSGNIVGCILWWDYGPEYATVGLVVVPENMQGKGLGRRLMDTVLSQTGARNLQLVATVAGKRLYQQCGFETVASIAQVQGHFRKIPPHPAQTATIDVIQQKDLAAICEFDAKAYGCDRSRLIQAIFAIGQGVVAREGGKITGFAFIRESGKGQTIGPVITDDEQVAKALICKLYAQVNGFVRFDLTDNAVALKKWLLSGGLQQVDEVSVMIKGEYLANNPSPKVMALTSQAFG